MPQGSPWLDVDQAAEALQLSPPTIYRRLRPGQLEGAVLAGRTVLSRESVEAYAARVTAGDIPRDLRHRCGADRPPSTWNDRLPPDRYLQTREG